MFLIGGIVLVVLLLGVFLLPGGFFGSDKDTTESTNTQTAQKSSSKFTAVNACDIFTKEEAQQILGASATQSTEETPTSTKDVSVSTCTYSNNAADVNSIEVASVLVRSGLSESGASTNKAVFGTGTPEGSEKVSGYGEDAYFTSSIGQLNVLKDNNWIIISNGPTKLSDKTLAKARQVADVTVK
jgi:cytoskeletal protein RodZ